MIQYTPDTDKLIRGLHCIDKSEAFRSHVRQLASLGLDIDNFASTCRASLCKSLLGLFAEVDELFQEFGRKEFSSNQWSEEYCMSLLSEFGDVLFWVRQVVTDAEGAAVGHIGVSIKGDFFSNQIDTHPYSYLVDNYPLYKPDYVIGLFDSGEKLARRRGVIKLDKVQSYVETIMLKLIDCVTACTFYICDQAYSVTMPAYLGKAFRDEQLLIQRAMVDNVTKLTQRQINREFEKALANV